MATAKHTTRPRPATKDATVREENRIIRRALRILESRARVPGERLGNMQVAGNWFRLRMGEYLREVFAVAWLDNRNCLIEFRELFFGTNDRAHVYVRDVVKSALDCNASSALLAHNHPSGHFDPSDCDVSVTRDLVTALEAVGVRVLDHFIITAGTVPFSMASEGMVVGRLEGMRRRVLRQASAK